MKLAFTKYHGAGNDFIMLDGIATPGLLTHLTQKVVADLCDRRFGIGADGLIVMQPHKTLDFEMVYYNADGSLSSMCGNGGRCLIDFAHHKGQLGNSGRFMAYDGEHEGRMGEVIALSMNEVKTIEQISDRAFFLDTGSPHYVVFMEEDSLEDLDIVTAAHKIRYNDRFREQGTNVNFVRPSEEGIVLRTYERGVEGETLACGTGVVASALATALRQGVQKGSHSIKVKARGGSLSVSFTIGEAGYQDIWLYGPAQKVYEGMVEV